MGRFLLPLATVESARARAVDATGLPRRSPATELAWRGLVHCTAAACQAHGGGSCRRHLGAETIVLLNRRVDRRDVESPRDPMAQHDDAPRLATLLHASARGGNSRDLLRSLTDEVGPRIKEKRAFASVGFLDPRRGVARFGLGLFLGCFSMVLLVGFVVQGSAEEMYTAVICFRFGQTAGTFGWAYSSRRSYSWLFIC